MSITSTSITTDYSGSTSITTDYSGLTTNPVQAKTPQNGSFLGVIENFKKKLPNPKGTTERVDEIFSKKIKEALKQKEPRDRERLLYEAFAKRLNIRTSNREAAALEIYILIEQHSYLKWAKTDFVRYFTSCGDFNGAKNFALLNLDDYERCNSLLEVIDACDNLEVKKSMLETAKSEALGIKNHEANRSYFLKTISEKYFKIGCYDEAESVAGEILSKKTKEVCFLELAKKYHELTKVKDENKMLDLAIKAALEEQDADVKDYCFRLISERYFELEQYETAETYAKRVSNESLRNEILNNFSERHKT